MVIERLEFELAYYDSAVQHFNHYTTETLSIDKGVHSIPKSISLKVNVIAQLEFDLVYNVFSVLHVSHYVTGIPLPVSFYSDNILFKGAMYFLGLILWQ